jgi:hypothetical protein
MAAEQYPKRPKFFANRLIRLLQKSCAANDIGIEACWLVTCIALVEDAAHYSKPVTFWTGQLLPITGFHSWGRLDRARERAVAAGWLHYRQGTSRQCGSYWTMIPEAVQRAFSDSPVDEVNHQNGDDDTEVNHQNGDEVGDPNVMIRRFKRDDPVNLPSLFPDPVPKREGARKNTFRKPTIEEVSAYAKAYCTENDFHAIAAEDFVDHFESNGWRVGGKSPMKDWQASLRKWIRREQPIRGSKASRPIAGSVVSGADVWSEVVRFCVDAKTTDPEYPNRLRQRFGKAVADSVLRIKVATIKNAADKRAAGNDFPLKELADQFRRMQLQAQPEEAAHATA